MFNIFLDELIAVK